MSIKRNDNEVYSYKAEGGDRNFIKINGKVIPYSHYVAKNNPDICGEWFEGCEVHHINHISNDDRPENLIVLTKEEHHQIHTKPVDVFYAGKYLGRFNNAKEIEKEFNIPKHIVSSNSGGKKNNRKYSKWRFDSLNYR